ncbi:MAG: hypothetical protein IT334_03495 [Thermomicrobiales bacterium]|nr:hypothetical protein [Thermomicrobiales bacterium]
MERNGSRGFLPLLVAFALLLGAISPLATFAQDDETDEEEPATSQSGSEVQFVLRGDGQGDGERIIVEIDPGERATIRVFIGNLGQEILPVFAFTSDVSTKLNGGLQLAPEGSEQHEPTTWIDFPTRYYDIEPQIEVGRDAEINVPEGTPPGEYVIPIAVETVNAYEVPGNANFTQKVRKVMAVYVVVPGEVQAGFELGTPRLEYERRRTAIYVPLVNTGQTSLRMQGQMVIKTLDGVTVMDEEFVMGTVYGLHETHVYQTLRTALPAGEYLVSLQLTDVVSGFTNGFEDVSVTMPEAPSGESAPLEFGEILVVPNAEPIQFAAVGVEIINNAQTVRSARLVLIVEKNGEPLEEFVLAENLILDQGVTTVAQRYLPLTGWEPGEYTFSLRLETVNSNGGASVLLTKDDAATIEVGD